MKSTGMKSTKNKNNNSTMTNEKTRDAITITIGLLLALLGDYLINF
jgi:hypothetical protein